MLQRARMPRPQVDCGRGPICPCDMEDLGGTPSAPCTSAPRRCAARSMDKGETSSWPRWTRWCR